MSTEPMGVDDETLAVSVKVFVAPAATLPERQVTVLLVAS
jgi:hypothetical protein